MSEWKPIDSAPKDGTRVLLATKSGWTSTGRWTEDAMIWEGEEHPHWIHFECDDFYYSVHLVDADEPTHWMRLPEPPVEPATEEPLHPEAGWREQLG
jgi:hypothetical protein